jgi:hypothetical protein
MALVALGPNPPLHETACRGQISCWTSVLVRPRPDVCHHLKELVGEGPCNLTEHHDVLAEAHKLRRLVLELVRALADLLGVDGEEEGDFSSAKKGMMAQTAWLASCTTSMTGTSGFSLSTRSKTTQCFGTLILFKILIIPGASRLTCHGDLGQLAPRLGGGFGCSAPSQGA